MVASVSPTGFNRVRRELEDLLERFEWFDGGRCISVSPAPGVSATPKRVEFVVHDVGDGGLRAGDLRTYRVVRLEANGVSAWSFEGAYFDQSPGHLISEFDPVETSGVRIHPGSANDRA